MKKGNVLQNSIIATFCMILCKIIGLIYVIPFNAMISASAGALYSYAYNIYVIFLSLSTGGIPIAISKLVSEYDSLKYYKTKEKIYKLGNFIICIIGIFLFVVMVVFADVIAKFIIGDAVGSNTVSDVSRVIRIISFALLIVPALSVTRGYLQGHNYMRESSISDVLEQFVRVCIILIGCLVVIKIFKMDEKIAIGISVLSASVSALVSYIYLLFKIKKNKKDLIKKNVTEKEVGNKEIIKKIVLCALPFIIVEVLKSAYATVDTVTIVRGLTDLGYSVIDAETTFSVIATWGNKLCSIVISISFGISMSLIPSVAGEFVKGNIKKVNEQFNSSLLLLLITTLPMTLGLFFLGRSVWILFYGYDSLSIEVFKLYIFQAITFSFFSIFISFLQTVNKSKVALVTLFISFILNAIFNIPFMHLCHYLGIGGYQGATVCTLVTQVLPALFLFIYTKKKFNFDTKFLVSNGFKIILSTMVMMITLYLVSIFYPINSINRFSALIECLVYGIVGFIMYAFMIYKTGVFKELFGNSRLLKKFKLIH
ncbi:MAG: oligosaccharide flippase family protein [Bacilli bacterium]|nr:oligosaccharide flippase family protein [Bacilli bacterium]MBP3920041.1 oligosaccharide flippase family protein [Bacilli bacterium]